MTELAGYLLSGLVTGAIFALMASGLTLSYAATGVFNFAHGAIGFLVALVFFELTTGLHRPVWPAAILSVGVLAPLLGYVLHTMMFRGLATAGETAQIVATIGLTIALPALGMWIVDVLVETFGFGLPRIVEGASARGLGPRPVEHWRVLGVGIDSDQVTVFVLAVLTAAALWAVLRRTSLGLRMRATVDRRSLASPRGVDVDATSAQAPEGRGVFPALAVVDTVAFMRLGRIVWTGPRAEADEDRLTSAYLGLGDPHEGRDAREAVEQ